MDMNDYEEYEKYEQARVYFEAAWLATLQVTKCAQCAFNWFQYEHNRLLEKEAENTLRRP